jgi:hypothetical protein
MTTGDYRITGYIVIKELKTLTYVIVSQVNTNHDFVKSEPVLPTAS